MKERLEFLQMAPHPQEEVISEDWNRPYTREQAAFPAVRPTILCFNIPKCFKFFTFFYQYLVEVFNEFCESAVLHHYFRGGCK